MSVRVSPVRHGEWRWLIVALVLSDAICVLAAFALAYLARYRLGWFSLQLQEAYPRDYARFVAVALPAWLFVFLASGMYDRTVLLGGPREYALAARACLAGFAIVAVLSFLTAGQPAISRGWLVATLPLSVMLVAWARFALRRGAYALRRHGLFRVRAVIVGANEQGLAIARQLADAARSGVEIVGFLDDYLHAGALVDGRWPVLGPPSHLPRLGVDEAIIVQHALTWESLHDLMRGLAIDRSGPTLRLAPTFFDLMTAGMTVGQRGNVPVVTVDRSRIAGLDAVLKAVFEYTVVSVLLVLLAPVMLVRVLRRRAARLRVLDRQRYTGLHGEPVNVAVFASEYLPRTPLARVLLKAPALLAVLRGRLALVGPRMMPAGQARSTTDQLALLSVRPGLTGPVSVAGTNGDEAGNLALELSYIRDYSIWRDLQIIFQRTIALVMTRETPEPSWPGVQPEHAISGLHVRERDVELR